jgi:formylmethanofuran dehydrogenase subunit D
MTLHYTQLCQTQLITLCVQYRFDDEVKDDAHGAFTPEMMKLPQATWIETFVEGVTDKSTGLPIFKELAWFAYKVSGVMCSVRHGTGPFPVSPVPVLAGEVAHRYRL